MVKLNPVVIMAICDHQNWQKCLMWKETFVVIISKTR